MKIGLVIDDSLETANNGVQQYVLLLGQWLSHKGHEVHYLTGQTKRSDLANLHSLSRNVAVRFNQNRLSIPLPANKAVLKRLLDKGKFDVIHVQMPYSPYLAARVIKLVPNNTAVIGTFHAVPASQIVFKLARLLAAWLGSSLTRFDEIISVSTAAQAFAKDVFRVESTVVSNLVDLSHFAFFKPGSKKSKSQIQKIVFLGRLVERKGCLELLEALNKLTFSDWQLVVAGDGPLRTKLERYTRLNYLTDKVKFLGYVSEEEKARLLANADLAIFPSTGGESFGIVLIEAMAAGAGVVLGGNNEGYRTVLQYCPDSLFNPTNQVEFTGKIEQFLTDKQRRQSAHNCQQQLVKRFDVELVGPKILKIYNSAIAKHRQKKHNVS